MTGAWNEWSWAVAGANTWFTSSTILGDEDNNTGDGNLDNSRQKHQTPITKVLRSNPKKLKVLFDPSADSAFDVFLADDSQIFPWYYSAYSLKKSSHDPFFFFFFPGTPSESNALK